MAVRPDEGSNQHALSFSWPCVLMRDPISMHSACTRFSWPCALMRGALGRTLRHSAALCGTLRHSAAIKWPSEAISGHQWPSAYLALSGSSAPRWAPYAQSNSQQRSWPRMLATRRAVPPAGPIWFTSTPASPDEGVHQRSSVLISGHQCSSELISAPSPHTAPSVAISAHQCSSELISAHSPHTVPAGSNDGRYSKHACTPSGRWRQLR